MNRPLNLRYALIKDADLPSWQVVDDYVTEAAAREAQRQRPWFTVLPVRMCGSCSATMKADDPYTTCYLCRTY